MVIHCILAEKLKIVSEFHRGTTHAHKWSNTYLCRVCFKISEFHCRKFDLPELSGDVWWDMGALLWPAHEVRKWALEEEKWITGEESPPVEVRGGKVMLIVFFDHWGPLYQHLVPPKVTVNKEHYLEVLKILWWHVNQRWPELKNWWILHQDKAFTSAT